MTHPERCLPGRHPRLQNRTYPLWFCPCPSSCSVVSPLTECDVALGGHGRTEVIARLAVRHCRTCHLVWLDQRVRHSSQSSVKPAYQPNPKRASGRALGYQQAILWSAHAASSDETLQVLRPCLVPRICSNALLVLACSVNIVSPC